MNTSKDRILDAAERVVLREGAGHLTLDKVAAEAGLSKGGVLYHYPTKEDLVRGMVARLHEVFHAERERLAALDPCPAGRVTRAHLHATLPPRPSGTSLRLNRLAAALLAAVAENPSLLEPLHHEAAELGVLFQRDGIDPVLATIVSLATDGLWMRGLFGVPAVDPALQDRVLAKLDELTRTSA